VRPTAPESVLLHVGPVVLHAARLDQVERWAGAGRGRYVNGKASLDARPGTEVLQALIGRRETPVSLDDAAPILVRLVSLRSERASAAAPWTSTLEWIARDFLPRPSEVAA